MERNDDNTTFQAVRTAVRSFANEKRNTKSLLVALSLAVVVVGFPSRLFLSTATQITLLQMAAFDRALMQVLTNSTTTTEAPTQWSSNLTLIATLVTAISTALSALILFIQYWRGKIRLQIEIVELCIEQSEPAGEKTLWGTFLAVNKGGEGTRIDKFRLDAKYDGRTLQKEIPPLSVVARQYPTVPGIYVPPHESVTFYFPWKLDANQLLSEAECKITFWHTHGRIMRSYTARPGRHQIHLPRAET
jgi:hypothetical protein